MLRMSSGNPASLGVAKMKNLLESKRFWAAVASVVAVAVGDKLPFSEQQISEIIMVVAAWIVGDSLRSTVQK